MPIGPMTALYVALAALGGLYWLSLRTHPYAPCKRCNGRGYFRHPIFRWTTRACGNCVRGSVIRFGAGRARR